jgi:hypothetical protein
LTLKKKQLKYFGSGGGSQFEGYLLPFTRLGNNFSRYFRVQDLGFKGQGSGLRGEGFRVLDLRVESSGF